MHVYPGRQFLNAVDTNLFQLGSTIPEKNAQTLDVFFGRGLSQKKKKKESKMYYFSIQNF